jgi:hypothetical protein
MFHLSNLKAHKYAIKTVFDNKETLNKNTLDLSIYRFIKKRSLRKFQAESMVKVFAILTIHDTNFVVNAKFYVM